jgi:dTDP-4-amino-4,6-dideoxygalactose transaminase
VFHLYVVQVADRTQLQKHLDAAGIGTGIHYPVALHLTKAYQHLGFRAGDFPISETAASRILSLPMFPGLSGSQQERIATEVLKSVGVGPTCSRG